MNAASILFQGSGRGALDGYPFQLLSPGLRASQSLRAPLRIESLRTSGDGYSILCTVGRGASLQSVVLLSLRSDKRVELLTTQGLAIFHPALSPDGSRVAVLAVQGQLDRPPSGTNVANLIVHSLNGSTEKPELVADVNLYGSDFSVAPIEWTLDSRRILLSANQQGDMRILEWDVESRASSRFDDGVFPRYSPDGRYLAFIQRRSVVVRTVDGSRPDIIMKREWTPTWLAWHPENHGLAFSESGPLWRARIAFVHPPVDEIKIIHETARISDLIWIRDAPAWPVYKA